MFGQIQTSHTSDTSPYVVSECSLAFILNEFLQCDPSGAYFAWKATAIGKNYVNGKTFLEKRYDDNMELEDAVHTAILTLKEGFEGQVRTRKPLSLCNVK